MANKLLARYVFNYHLCNFNRSYLKRVSCLTSRRYASSLYVSDRRAMKGFVFLVPHLDFDKQFDDIDRLQKVLELRKLNMDVIEMKKAWEFYKTIQTKVLSLESKKEEIGTLITALMQKEKNSEDEERLAKLFLQMKIVKNDLKAVKVLQWDLDESIIERLLKIPNTLDEKTPPKSSVILKSVGKSCTLPESNKSHIEIGEALDLLEYTGSMHYYLLNDAASFELGVLNLAGKILTDNDMIRLTGYDFCRSFVVEGSGLNHEDPTDSFTLDYDNETDTNLMNRLHLVGGASLPAMLGLHAKQLILPQFFPIKYYSVGRQYVPFLRGNTSGLFTVCQASAVHIFLMINDKEPTEYMTEFEKTLETVEKFYSSITDHFRVVMRSASELEACEEMRVSFELWSPFSKQYIEVGYISKYGKYLSKRLLIGCGTAEAKEFPSIISGTMLSVPRLLGCLLEENPNKFVIPAKVVEQMPFYHT